MDVLMRQNDPTFKSVLHNLNEGTMDERSTDFLLNRCLYNLCPEEREEFESTTIYLMAIWDQTRRITLKHLKIFQGPYTIIRPQYSSSNPQGQNHCISEMSYPSVSALCIGAIVMLFKNVVVEEKLMNGSMGAIIDIVYDDARGSKIIGLTIVYCCWFFWIYFEL